jgi:uracil-DNA glycosylase
VNLIPEWKAHLGAEFEKPYMAELREFLKAEKEQRKVIFPPTADVFNAFNHAAPADVKVVILGQDPYHGPGQAHGLCFSVQDGVPVPPSLLNIYKEIETDLGIPRPKHGNLAAWAAQGVFLLNATLTVEQGNAGAHQGKGWETFTDKAISVINEQSDNVVFMLWGAYAQKKGAIIDASRHLVLKGPHPSPLSAYRGFLGCQHFSQANRYLQERGRVPIEWEL